MEAGRRSGLGAPSSEPEARLLSSPSTGEGDGGVKFNPWR
jgi:hypothetical protein